MAKALTLYLPACHLDANCQNLINNIRWAHGKKFL